MADENMNFIGLVKGKVTEYGITTNDLCINLAIEKFKDLRNYPASWSEEKVVSDLEKHISKIAMAAIEVDAKIGAENQTSHSENGISRSYSENIMAYRDVVGFASIS